MPQAHANPDEIRKFANKLQSYLNTLERETSSLRSAFMNLQGTWKDQQSQSFERKLQELSNAQASFRENAKPQIGHLLQMAKHLEDYLRQ